MSARPAAWLGRDLVGLVLLAALAGWSVLSAHLRGGSPRNMVGSLALLAAGYLLGRLTARWSWVVAVLSIGGFGAWVLVTPGAFSGGPLAGPLGYANANAALAVEVAAIALIAATRSRRTVARALLVVAALPVLAVAWFNQSWAALLPGLALFVITVIVLYRRPRRSGAAIVTAAAIVGLAVVGQLLVATGTGDGPAARALSERRVDLWTDAVHLARQQPLFGHGPQSFATASPTAASDPDTRAAHSELLQVAAETGLVGAGLLLLIVGWAYLALARAPDPGPAIVGAFAWSAFAVHALVDYVANFPLVVAAAGLALGLAVGSYSARTVRTARHRQA